MKQVVRIILAAAAVAALAVPAMAENKLIVKNAGATADVFTVDDTGVVTAKKTGLGLSVGLSPAAPFHLVDLTNAAARGVIVGQHDASAAAANVIFRKSKGTDAVPAPVAQNDFIAAFHGNVWDGAKYVTTATVNYFMDGPVTTTSAPQAIIFSTGVNGNGSADPGNKTERLRVTSSGNVVIGNKAGSSTAAVMGVADTVGFMYVPTVNGTLTSCASITQYAGHAPLWIDVVGNKVCTCNGTALKCSAVLN